MNQLNPLAGQLLAKTVEVEATHGSRRTSAPASQAEEEVYQPTPEFVRAMELVKLIPQVRQEVVNEVAQRLAAGDYQSPETTEETVKAIMSAELSQE